MNCKHCGKEIQKGINPHSLFGNQICSQKCLEESADKELSAKYPWYKQEKEDQ